MSQQFRKSVVEEAKVEFDEIKKFAEVEAAKKVNEAVMDKLDKLFQKNINEDVTVKIDNHGKVEIKHDQETVDTIEPGDDKVLTGGEMEGMEENMPIKVSDEESPIMVKQESNIEEMQNMEQEAKQTNEAQPAAAAPAAPTATDTTAAPAPAATETPEAQGNPAEQAIKAELDQVKTMLAQLMSAQGIAPAPAAAPGAEGAGEQIEVIDDEAGTQPAAAAPAPAPAAAAPVAEEFEVEFEEANNPIEEIEVIDDVETKDGNPVKEMRTLGYTTKGTGDRQIKKDKMEKEKGHHAPVTAIVNESTIKAQYESRIDELTKENARLKNENAEMINEHKEFETAFVSLREQFDEMQTFNGKMAMVNMLLAQGGFSQKEKIKICEEFEKAKTIEEAEKLYKTIIKEGRLETGAPVETLESKLKQPSTKAAKSAAQPLYENTEARRAKILAGIIKENFEE